MNQKFFHQQVLKEKHYQIYQDEILVQKLMKIYQLDNIVFDHVEIVKHHIYCHVVKQDVQLQINRHHHQIIQP